MTPKIAANLYIILVISLFIILPIILIKKDNKRKKQQDVSIEKAIRHIGGHPYLSSGEAVFLQIRNDKTIHIYREKPTIIDERIELSQIIKYEIKSEEQIQKDITLGRFLTLGLASLAFQKKSTVVNEYLLFSYIKSDIQIDCLFKGIEQIGDIASAITRLRIEENIDNNNTMAVI